MENRQKALNLLGLSMRAGKLISGTETVIADLPKKKIKIIILASDLQSSSREKVERAAKNARVAIIDSFSGTEITHAIGKSRKVIAITDIGFTKALVKLINEGV